MLKKWLARAVFSWLSWWMFQPVMTQLLVVVVAAEAEATLRATAATPAAAVAARVMDRRVMSFLTGLAVTVLADMTTPLRNCVHVCACITRMQEMGGGSPEACSLSWQGFPAPAVQPLNRPSCRN